jgi:pyrimidine-nucleoside phosphorylase
MKTRTESRKLAKSLIQVAERLGIPCRAILTRMDQPLGYAVGNSIEILECIEILKNEKNQHFQSSDLKELTLQFCAHMLQMGGLSRTVSDAKKLAQARLQDGSAWKSFQKMVLAQEGRLEELKPLAPHQVIWRSPKSGYFNKMDAAEIGRILIELGGGRRQAGEPIDHEVGLAFHEKLGSKLHVGDPIVTVYAQEKHKNLLKKLEKQFLESLEIGSTRKSNSSLILEQLG